MFLVPESMIDSLIGEDLPYGDLTCDLMGIGHQAARMRIAPRRACVVASTEEAVRVLERLGAEVTSFIASGTRVECGDAIIEASGPAQALHAAWKVSANILETYSGIATATADIVEQIDGRCPLLITRKGVPGTKLLSLKATAAGGAHIHRAGLSETVLIFDRHRAFVGGIDGLIDGGNDSLIARMKRECPEKKIIVEATLADAERLLAAGADGIQFDKVSAGDLSVAASALKAAHPQAVLLAAGGIDASNAAEYAATGIDGIVTSSPLHAHIVDMAVALECV